MFQGGDGDQDSATLAGGTLVIDWQSLEGVSTVRIRAPSTRCSTTPAGRFYIRERLRKRRDSPIYGPWAFGTSAYSALSDWPGGGVVGIHGTNQPGLIPGRPSHGCIRVRNPANRAARTR
jgi:lipoprotein-anchoring transpeptidase ErfK/SrfK